MTPRGDSNNLLIKWNEFSTILWLQCLLHLTPDTLRNVHVCCPAAPSPSQLSGTLVWRLKYEENLPSPTVWNVMGSKNVLIPQAVDVAIHSADLSQAPMLTMIYL